MTSQLDADKNLIWSYISWEYQIQFPMYIRYIFSSLKYQDFLAGRLLVPYSGVIPIPKLSLLGSHSSLPNSREKTNSLPIPLSIIWKNTIIKHPEPKGIIFFFTFKSSFFTHIGRVPIFQKYVNCMKFHWNYNEKVSQSFKKYLNVSIELHVIEYMS